MGKYWFNNNINIVFISGTISFTAFWKWFAKTMMKEDWIRFSDLIQGQVYLQKDNAAFLEVQAARKSKQEELDRRDDWRKVYDEFVDKIRNDKQLKKILKTPPLPAPASSSTAEPKKDSEENKESGSGDEKKEGDSGSGSGEEKKSPPASPKKAATPKKGESEKEEEGCKEVIYYMLTGERPKVS